MIKYNFPTFLAQMAQRNSINNMWIFASNDIGSRYLNRLAINSRVQELHYASPQGCFFVWDRSANKDTNLKESITLAVDGAIVSYYEHCGKSSALREAHDPIERTLSRYVLFQVVQGRQDTTGRFRVVECEVAFR